MMTLAPDSTADTAAAQPDIPDPSTTTSALTVSVMELAGMSSGVKKLGVAVVVTVAVAVLVAVLVSVAVAVLVAVLVSVAVLVIVFGNPSDPAAAPTTAPTTTPAPTVPRNFLLETPLFSFFIDSSELLESFDNCIT
jgi:hypothetical protein